MEGHTHGKTGKVAGKYLPLHTHLMHRHADKVVLRFTQIEDLLGFTLPAPAYTQQEWWTTDAGGDTACSDAWRLAGRTARANVLARNVAFERTVIL